MWPRSGRGHSGQRDDVHGYMTIIPAFVSSDHGD